MLKHTLPIFALLLIPTSVFGETSGKGLVTSRSCPFSCRTEGIPKNVCRDWKEGDLCYIEDLRKAPSPGQASSTTTSENRSSDCQNVAASQLAEPRIEIARVKPTGNVLDNKVRITGTIEGSCLSEAGLFEEGRKVESIAVNTSPEFRRYDFEVVSREERDPEIRVYNIKGDRDTYPVAGRAGMGGRSLTDRLLGEDGKRDRYEDRDYDRR